MKYPEFNILEILIAAGWLFIFIIFAHLIRARHQNDSIYKYYLPNFYIKIVMGFAFAMVYFLVYHGGDTIAYWSGSTNLSRLMIESPLDFIKELVDNETHSIIPNYFEHGDVGKPPIWIYREPNSWFICKIASFFSLICFESYLAMTFFFGMISSFITWRFFKFLNEFLDIKTSYIAIAILFVPTVSFWCSGLMKDTVVWWAIMLMIQEFFQFLKGKINFKSLFIFITSFFIIFSTRSFVIISLTIPMLIIVVFRLNSTKSFLTKFLTRTTGVFIALSIVVIYLNSSGLFGEFSSNNLIQTAESIQRDFANNVGYSGKKYDLGITDFESWTLIKVAPLAIFTTFFRPFIWEAGSPIMIMNGLEGLFFIFMFLKIFQRSNRIAQNNSSPTSIQNRDFILFALIFALILAYFVGITSGIFGVLARLKAPVLPFFLLVVFSRLKEPSVEGKLIKKSGVK